MWYSQNNSHALSCSCIHLSLYLAEPHLGVPYGFVASLNGVEFARQNVLAAQDSSTVAGASRERGLLEHRLVLAPPAGLLVAGDNVLAIEVHNVASTSSDLYLSAQLRGVLDDVVVDAGFDAGLADAGVDAGPSDAGPSDAGPSDAGSSDGGSSDGGADEDAGQPDAGSRPDSVTGGCSCSAVGGEGAWFALLCLGSGALRRRRSSPFPLPLPAWGAGVPIS